MSMIKLDGNELSLQSLINGFNDAIFLCHFDASLLAWNQAAKTLLSDYLCQPCSVGVPLPDILDLDSNKLFDVMQQSRSQTGVIPTRVMLKALNNGQNACFKLYCSVLRSSQNKRPKSIMLRFSLNESKLDFRFRDLQARMQQTQTALKAQRALATLDPLTGLSNRRHFLDLAKQCLLAKKRTDVQISLIMLDIDYFKQINDNYGHAVGDVVLRDISALVKDNCRENDLVCRWGGEEFIVLSTHANHAEATQLAERLRTAIEDGIFDRSNHQLRVTISLGVANAQVDESCEKLINRADEALYKAKLDGRNRAVVA